MAIPELKEFARIPDGIYKVTGEILSNYEL